MGTESLSPEQMEKAKACASPEELQEFLDSENIKLSEDEIEGIAGGGNCTPWCMSNYLPCPGNLI